MKQEVLQAKLNPPRNDPKIIQRPRLLEAVQGRKEWKAAWLGAPAGYGKTVFAHQLASSLACPAAWYRIDSLDNDPIVFLQYFTASIGRVIPGFGREAIAIAEADGFTPRMRALIAMFADELQARAREGLVLVLDDYHEVSDPVIHQFTAEVLHHFPDGVRVLITSRLAPPFSVARLQLEDRLVMVGVEDLRFSREEVAAFLGRRQSPPEEYLDRVCVLTVGWAAALKMVGVSPDGDRLRQVPAFDIRTLYQYLADEVLENQAQPVREFLFATSVLEALTPRLCDSMLGRDDSGAILAALEKQQLFVELASDEPKSYRYHPLFREFLMDRLGTRKSELMRRAGEAFRNLGDVNRAIEYFIAGGALPESRDLIRIAGREALRRGCWQTVERWLSVLPAELVMGDPWLSFYRSSAEVYRGRLDEAQTWIEGAQEGFDRENSEAGAAECFLLRARIARIRGRYHESLSFLQSAMPCLLPENDGGPRFDVPIEYSLVLSLTGRLREARNVLEKAVHSVEPAHDGYVLAHLLEGLGNVHAMLGEYPEALRLYKRGTRVSPERVLPGYYMQDFMVQVYQDWGHFDRALECARRNLALKEQYGFVEALPSASLQLAAVHLCRREFAQAEACHRRVIELARESGGERFYNTMNLAFLARTLSMIGRLAEARVIAEGALRQAIEQSGLVLAAVRGVAGVIFIQTGNRETGFEMLEQAITDLETMGFKKASSEFLGWAAWASELEGDHARSRQYAFRCLASCAAFNHVQDFYTYYEYFRVTLKAGLEEGVEPAFCQRVAARLGALALDLFFALARSENPEVRRRIVIPLAEIRDAQAEMLLSRLAGDADPETRRLAETGLGRQVREPQRADAAEGMLLQCFGPLRVFSGHKEVPPDVWRTVKARDLLAYLFFRNEPVTRERIIEDIWPECSPDQAVGRFHTTLHLLRKALQSACGGGKSIVYAGGRYQLETDFFSSDVLRFETLLCEAQRLSAGAQMERLEKAIGLYRGDYLEDLDYPWVVAGQEHFRQLHCEARERLGRYYLRQGKDLQRAVIHLRELVRLKPLDEGAHGLLMEAFAGQRDFLAVKRQYETLARGLDEEMGLAPTAAARELYYRLCRPDGVEAVWERTAAVVAEAK